MTPKQFIEKAIEGGWTHKGYLPKVGGCCHYNEAYGTGSYTHDSSHVVIFKICEMFLDPLAWQAVGKVEEWKEEVNLRDSIIYRDYIRIAHINMHRMIDTLCEGRSIEQFLENL